VLVPLADLPKVTQPLAAAMPSRWAFEGMVVPEAQARPRIRLSHPAAPHPESHTEAEPRRRVPVVLTAGGQRRFILPGRQRIADALEDAAAKAEQEMKKAQADGERKAAAMKREMEAQAERKTAEMRRLMEEKMQESQREFERKSAEMNAAVQERVQEKVTGRIKTQMEEANKSVEDKLREIQDGMEAERKKMNDTLEKLGAAGDRAIVPAAAPRADGEIDMAERFFARKTWRAPPPLPLAVLAAMIAAGIVATGIVLRRRDITGR
jgi:Skp family chaperone for outer membrane proteins